MSEMIMEIFLVVFFIAMMALIVWSSNSAKLENNACSEAGGVLIFDPSRVNTVCIKPEAILYYE